MTLFKVDQTNGYIMIMRFSLFIVLSAMLVSLAQAHSKLTDSIPANRAKLDQTPNELVLKFSEPVVLMDVTLERKNADQARIKLSVKANEIPHEKYILPLPELQSGIYKVRWKGYGSDEHHTRGRFRFEIH